MSKHPHPDQDLFADETCDHHCRVIGGDGLHRCMDAIANANPDGLTADEMAFYMGISRQGAEQLLRRIMARARLVRGLAPIHRDHIAA